MSSKKPLKEESREQADWRVIDRSMRKRKEMEYL